jgi:putative glutamine amidotransferase
VSPAAATSRRPIVGITSYVAQASWGFWKLPAALVPLGYVDAVTAAGGRPVVLPPLSAGIEETLAALDALILCGGPDLDPAGYGEARSPATSTVDPGRDAAELGLLRAALERDLAVLGICRGMQLINVAYGGTLVQHLPDVVGHCGHRTQPGQFDVHPVALGAESQAGTILGPTVSVRSGHHQGVGRLGAGLLASGRAPDDSVEAIEDPARRFVLGVLWHPEEGQDLRLFEALLAAVPPSDGRS